VQISHDVSIFENIEECAGLFDLRIHIAPQYAQLGEWFAYLRYR
jgi:hypothetical protein